MSWTGHESLHSCDCLIFLGSVSRSQDMNYNISATAPKLIPVCERVVGFFSMPSYSPEGTPCIVRHIIS